MSSFRSQWSNYMYDGTEEYQPSSDWLGGHKCHYFRHQNASSENKIMVSLIFHQWKLRNTNKYFHHSMVWIAMDLSSSSLLMFAVSEKIFTFLMMMMSCIIYHEILKKIHPREIFRIENLEKSFQFYKSSHSAIVCQWISVGKTREKVWNQQNDIFTYIFQPFYDGNGKSDEFFS